MEFYLLKFKFNKKNVETELNKKINQLDERNKDGTLTLYGKASLLEQKKNLIAEIFKDEIQKNELKECTFNPNLKNNFSPNKYYFLLFKFRII